MLLSCPGPGTGDAAGVAGSAGGVTGAAGSAAGVGVSGAGAGPGSAGAGVLTSGEIDATVSAGGVAEASAPGVETLIFVPSSLAGGAAFGSGDVLGSCGGILSRFR